MLKKSRWLVAAALTCCAAPVGAQEALLGQYYGNGVHDYNGGDYKKSYADLTAAIDAGTKDPRCFYFRGLTLLRMGREANAVADFQKGAQLEAADVNNTFPVSRSLERVQGPDRIKLEGYRAEARMVIYTRQQKEREQRFQARKRAEEAVMRRIPEPAALPEASKASGGDDVFGTAPKVEPSKVAPKEPADPFGTPAKGADPFASPMPKPDAAPGGAAPDPFGGPAPMPKPDAAPPAADPFGGGTPAPLPKPDAAPAPMPPADPAPPAADPFGGGAPAPAPTPKPDAAPAPMPPAADPFGGGAPAPAPTPKPEAAVPPATDPVVDAATVPAPKPDAALSSDAKVTTKGLVSVFGSMVKSIAGGDAAATPAAPGPGFGPPAGFGGPPAAPLPAPVPAPAPAASADKAGDDPFAAPVTTKKESAPAGDDPFGAPAMPKKDTPASDDPFAAPAAVPAPAKKAPSDDPFKDDADQSPPKAAPAKPEAPKPADDDPFGK